MLEWLTLSNIGSVASILGIGLSLYVVYNVREIRKSYLFAARAPDLLKRLRSHSAKINELLEEFDASIAEIEAELARCSSILESLGAKVSRHERRSISLVIRQINLNKTLSIESRDVVWEIYKELLKVDEEMTNLLKDKLWER